MRLLLILCCCWPWYLWAQADGAATYRPLRSGSWVQDKNFYVLTLMEQMPEVSKALQENATLKQIVSEKKRQMVEASTVCDTSLACQARAFRWNNEEIAVVSQVFNKNLNQKAITMLIEEQLRPSGAYQLFATLDDREMLIKSWGKAAQGINGIINTYALGRPGRYPAIDSVSYNVAATDYQRLINVAVNVLAEDTTSLTLFFQPSLRFALMLLELNNRDEAARYEPMEAQENQAAFEVIPAIDWDRYPYSVILVPGFGPEEADVPLSPLAKLRNDLAVRRYRQGLAPLIVVSGGNVHPHQTLYNEAEEMKRDLIQRLGVPEQAILIEPHARHTTTNFRNTARLIFRYGIPPDQPALVTTTQYQSHYITDQGLDERCEEELGYVPFRIVERLNQHDVVWLPQKVALQINPTDPLDP